MRQAARRPTKFCRSPGADRQIVLDIRDVEIIAPNFKRRLSGVTSTIVQLIPCQIKLGVKIATLGPGLPDHLPRLRWTQLAGLWRRPRSGRCRIWHARRNNEMAAGIFLKHVLRMPLKLVFTSAAQRRHSSYTRFLIRQMDAVIATSAPLRLFPPSAAYGDQARRGPRPLPPAANRRRHDRSDRPARQIPRRLLRPHPPSKGHRPLRKGDDRAAAANIRSGRR